MCHVSVLLAGSVLLFIQSTEAFQIPECGTDGYVDVLEFKETKLTCHGLSRDSGEDFLWQIVQDGRETPIASCSIWACQPLDDSGNFSVTSSSASNSSQLTIKQSHRQMNGKIFRCSSYIEVWSEPAECKLCVIYGPASAIISGPQYIIVHGSRTTVLICSTDDVNPSVHYTWTGGISCIQQQGNGSSCLFTPSVDVDGKTVTCTATNARVNNITAMSTYTLNISYPPSSPPSITGYTEMGFVTEGDTVQLVCTVHGGKPVVSSVMFSCNSRQGDHGTLSTDKTQSTLSFQASVSVDNGTRCTCSGDWSPEPSLYQMKSTVTLHVAAAAQPKITFLSLNGVEGDLTVDSLTRVVARCSATSHTLPTISLMRADTGLKLMRDTDTDPTVLDAANFTLTSFARCQDTAIYTCRASNTAGSDERNITLLVNCAPTVDDKHLNLTSHIFVINASRELELALVAYPSPEDNKAVFLGESVPMETFLANGTVSHAIRVTCQRDKDVIYKCLCTISITDKADTKSGYHSVTLKNPFGSVSLSVYVVHGPQMTDDAGPQKTDDADSAATAAIAGGVAAAAGFVIVVLIIVIIILKRKSMEAYERPQRSLEDTVDPSTGPELVTSADRSTLDSYEDVGGYQNQIDLNTYDHPQQGEPENNTYTALALTANTGRSLDDYEDVDGGHHTTGHGSEVNDSSTPAPGAGHNAEPGVQRHVYQNVL